MKQILQSLRNGQTEVANVPAPAVGPGQVLIRTHRSLISAGTERMIVEFGRSGMIQKIRSQPEKVREVISKIKTDGLASTFQAVSRKLEAPVPLGYSSVGTVMAVGAGAEEFAPGDRVVSNGPHAEVVCVGKHLVARIPDGVSDEQASFTVVGSIALQGIRLIEPTLGERVAVYGLGLIGLLAVQLLRANGCEVLGIDVDQERLEMARAMGATCVNATSADITAAARGFTAGQGIDAVLITASSRSDEILRNAAEMCRLRGRIVLVGVVGTTFNRDAFYKKELSFQVSCSYGPGRYDDKYESGQIDYPAGYVRWTEQRNFQAVLDAIAAGQVQVDSLIRHRLPIAGAAQAYRTLSADRGALGVMLTYPPAADLSPSVQLHPSDGVESGQGQVAVIGAGSFASGVLIPALAETGATISAIASRQGASARHAARKYRALRATTDVDSIFADGSCDAVVLATRPGSLAALACRALAAGKHTFVEKPLAVTPEQLAEVVQAARSAPERILMVGYNRQFSPHTRYVLEQIRGRTEPVSVQMTVNAGHISSDHWVHDAAKHGRRIISEGCHFIDLLRCLAGSRIETVSAICPQDRPDQMSVLLGFADGSTGTLSYLANGSKQYPKEICEVFCEGRVHRIDNFRRTTSWPGKGCKTRRQDKGHDAEMRAFVEAIRTGAQPMALDELVNVSAASFAAIESARTHRSIDMGEWTREILGQTPAGQGQPDGQVIRSGQWSPGAKRPAAPVRLKRSA